jgi:hypothetical protein
VTITYVNLTTSSQSRGRGASGRAALTIGAVMMAVVYSVVDLRAVGTVTP